MSKIRQCARCWKYTDGVHTCSLKKVKIFWKTYTMEDTVKNIEKFTKWGNTLNIKNIIWKK